MVKTRLEELMGRQGMKVAQLAYHAEVSDAAIYNILNGADPKLSTLARIARALGVATCELLNEEERDGFIDQSRNKLEALGVMAA